MPESIISSPLQSKVWRILFLILSITVIALFCCHTFIMQLTRQAALRLDALNYTWNLMNSSLSIEIGTWLLITWLAMVFIFFTVHPGHKSSPYPFLVLQGFFFGMLLATLWTGRVQIFLQFNYTATPPEDMLFQATFAIPIYELICVGIVLLVIVITILTWFKVIKFEPVA